MKHIRGASKVFPLKGRVPEACFHHGCSIYNHEIKNGFHDSKGGGVGLEHVNSNWSFFIGCAIVTICDQRLGEPRSQRRTMCDCHENFEHKELKPLDDKMRARPDCSVIVAFYSLCC